MVLFSPPARIKVEVYRFKFPVLILVPLFALALQAYLPLYLDAARFLDLPLLVVIYFGLVRRSPVSALIGGAFVGMAQDSLSRGPIGLFGAAKTVIGYVTSTMSTHLDTERPVIRFVIIFVLYWLQAILVYILGSVLLGQPVEIAAGGRLLAALVNGLVGVLLFQLLDRFREPA
ncbi:MAG: rod shape-determining protein MreD [Acidobacteria bacterium RIFCSPLOWO2_12_FULL_59_11]|nr:MAG: rod shape-determining protein MreD [Acidobacteria bacterium RIFCSPLOWO2_12_FULL_59_11]